MHQCRKIKLYNNQHNVWDSRILGWKSSSKEYLLPSKHILHPAPSPAVPVPFSSEKLTCSLPGLVPADEQPSQQPVTSQSSSSLGKGWAICIVRALQHCRALLSLDESVQWPDVTAWGSKRKKNYFPVDQCYQPNLPWEGEKETGGQSSWEMVGEGDGQSTALAGCSTTTHPKPLSIFVCLDDRAHTCPHPPPLQLCLKSKAIANWDLG